MRIIIFLLLSNLCWASVKVGVAWEGKSNMANRVLSGFIERADEIFVHGVEYKFHENVESKKVLAQILPVLEKQQDAMLVLRSSGAKVLKEFSPKIPSFIGASNHPGLLGVIDNLEQPEGNITGVSYFVPFEKRFQVFKEIMPNLSSILLITEIGHPGSKVDIEETKKITKKLGIQYQHVDIDSVFQLLTPLKEIKNVDAIILGSQAILMDNIRVIQGLAPKLPVLAYSSKPVADGAIVGLVANDFKLGKLLAESVYDVVVKGKSIKEVPVKFDDDPEVYFNQSAAKKFGIKLPSNLSVNVIN